MRLKVFFTNFLTNSLFMAILITIAVLSVDDGTEFFRGDIIYLSFFFSYILTTIEYLFSKRSFFNKFDDEFLKTLPPSNLVFAFSMPIFPFTFYITVSAVIDLVTYHFFDLKLGFISVIIAVIISIIISKIINLPKKNLKFKTETIVLENDKNDKTK